MRKKNIFSKNVVVNFCCSKFVTVIVFSLNIKIKKYKKKRFFPLIKNYCSNNFKDLKKTFLLKI